ncbi:hypothetical protein IF1G_11026 [Cordyceps javanica]|uniref:C2H2-type domain-containing protein n=1 Tax=Cordyceps javanica TaxID=43265 RepID=A0A545ULD5_9HYPO|nr:hypothetical protein IF1G_11026 [Cordyceps javanica]TQW01719.1 c2H2-type zinc finger domain-containing protein [Cordyceps javanica]
MWPTLSASPTDGAQESQNLIDFRDPSRQTSHHGYDFGTYSTSSQVAPVENFPSSRVQSLESIPTVPVANSPLLNPSSLQFHSVYPPLTGGGGNDPFAMLQQACDWTAYTPVTDLYHGGYDSIHTNSTLGTEAVKRDYFSVDSLSDNPFETEHNASRSGSSVGLVTHPAVSSGVTSKTLVGTTGRRMSSRKEDTASGDERLTPEDENSRHRPQVSRKERPFACPFYRRWPTRHFECMNRKLSRIQDVKQHIYRRHSKSPFYCPRCSKVFACPDLRDKHILEARCSPATTSSACSSDVISAQVQISLKNRTSRGLSPIDQWYGIWDLIFPDMSRPKNVHFDSLATEMMSTVKDLWKNEGQRIIPCLMRPNTAQPIDEADLQTPMAEMPDKAQDHSEGEPSQEQGVTAGARDSQGDQRTDGSSVEGRSGGFAKDDENSYEPSPPDQFDNVCYSLDGFPRSIIVDASYNHAQILGV